MRGGKYVVDVCRHGEIWDPAPAYHRGFALRGGKDVLDVVLRQRPVPLQLDASAESGIAVVTSITIHSVAPSANLH